MNVKIIIELSYRGVKLSLNYKEKEPIFWCVFEELSDNSNELLVDHDRLQERLIPTGKLFASHAFIIIGYMEKSGK